MLALHNRFFSDKLMDKKQKNGMGCANVSYRTLEIALLRSVSYSVSLAPMVALRMMPSSILFRARNSRFGFPKYPLSAKTFLTGSFV